MSKLPAFQFYPADWRKDPGVQSLSFHDRGVWFEILCLMHESEQRGRLLLNGKAMPDEALARLLGLDKQILTKTVATLLEYGVASRDKNGALMNRRMVRDENLRIIRQEAGKLGGNPVLVKQNSTKTKNEVKQNSTPSSSSSSSSSTPELNKKPKERESENTSRARAPLVNGKSLIEKTEKQLEIHRKYYPDFSGSFNPHQIELLASMVDLSACDLAFQHAAGQGIQPTSIAKIVKEVYENKEWETRNGNGHSKDEYEQLYAKYGAKPGA